jgi:NTP pyrophosphatase (non-canonical NTP hydrolase)
MLEKGKNMVSNEELESPLNAVQQLMAITAEESGELTQVCMKIMRKYTTLEEIYSDKYRDSLIEEAGDVLCMLELMVEHGFLTNEELDARVIVKRKKLSIWSNLIK